MTKPSMFEVYLGVLFCLTVAFLGGLLGLLAAVCMISSYAVLTSPASASGQWLRTLPPARTRAVVMVINAAVFLAFTVTPILLGLLPPVTLSPAVVLAAATVGSTVWRVSQPLHWASVLVVWTLRLLPAITIPFYALAWVSSLLGSMWEGPTSKQMAVMDANQRHLPVAMAVAVFGLLWAYLGPARRSVQPVFRT